MQRKYYFAIGAIIIAAAVVVWSRQDKYDAGGRVELRGNVTIDGKPVSSGRVEFRPDSFTKGPAAAGTIKDGHFAIASMNGVLPGRYEVKVTLNRPTKQAIMNEAKADHGSLEKKPKTKLQIPRSDTYKWPNNVLVPAGRRGIEFDFAFSESLQIH